MQTGRRYASEALNRQNNIRQMARWCTELVKLMVVGPLFFPKL